MIELTGSDIEKALVKIEAGLHKYCWIQENIFRRDVSRDPEFRKNYNGFYRVRQRPAEWYGCYFSLMERAKAEPHSFAQILEALHQQTGNIEASFSSKLVATLDPHKPVIDSFVLGHFGLKAPYYYEKDRVTKWGLIYTQLRNEYEKLLQSPIARLICDKFDAVYPQASISPLKKVDLVLWQTR